jgi:DNA polymerase-3 subunit epsilon
MAGLFPRLAFVDLETTGATAASDRITEIGIVQVDEDGVREWSSLVRPQRRIPAFIQRLTGITDDMVEDAPRFADLADEVAAKLHGYLFVAHNARFDHGFLKSEFGRMETAFDPPVLCTVRLSRRLYPQHARHGLDALIARHGLDVTSRHRALGDARLLWQFWQRIHTEFSAEHVASTIADLNAKRAPRRRKPAAAARIAEAAT